MATLHVHPVENPDDPDLKPYRTLRRRKDLERQQLFVVEGDKTVVRLLESRFPVASLLITEDWLKRIEPLLARRADVIDVFSASKEQIEQITGFTSYQGIKALARIDRPDTLESVLRDSPRPCLFAALDGIANAENLGVIVRNCAAFGVQAVLVGDTSASPFLTRAIRTSMGAIFRIPAVDNLKLPETLRALREHGVRCLAAHPHTQQRLLFDADFRGDCCLVFGSEGDGLSAEVLAVCDEIVAIPMHSNVDSLNVSSAVAAFLYEVHRQRQTRLEQRGLRSSDVQMRGLASPPP